MYFLLTLFIGWVLLNFLISLLELILNIPRNSIGDPFFIYVFTGYVVCMILRIKSPFIVDDKETPFSSIKKIELKLFFKDVYYAIWWPYYIIRDLRKK